MHRRIRLDCDGRTTGEILDRLSRETAGPGAVSRLVLHLSNAGRINDSLCRLIRQLLALVHERELMVSIVDPTGCGDAFAGGMMGAIASGNPDHAAAQSFETLRRAMVYGTVVASFNIEEFSLERLKKLSRAELDKRYAEYASMVRV